MPNWLALIAPPASLTHEWLRPARPERSASCYCRQGTTPLPWRTLRALRLGRSHTVVS